jgi:hypothetical protein
MRTIEVYTEVTAPPLYDYFIDKQGVFEDMDVPPPAEGVTQVVCEGDFVNNLQLVAVQHIAKLQEADIYFFTDPAPSF